MNIGIKIAFGSLMVIFLITSTTIIYSNVWTFVIFKNGKPEVADGHYVPMPIGDVIYFTFFWLAEIVSVIGILLRNRFTYLLFHIFSIPAIIGFLIDIWHSYSDLDSISFSNILCLTSLLVMIVLLNWFRSAFYHPPVELNLKSLLIVLAGIIANVGVLFLLNH
jgi:hypothetical protein